MKNEIDKLHDEIKQANIKIKGEKSEKKAFKHIILSSVILLVVSLVVVFFPNIRVMYAEHLYANGNIKEAFQTIRSTHKYRWPIHLFFPEEKIDRLANEMYWNGAFGIDSITTFSNNVIGAIETADENAIAALLEDGRIVIKEKNSRESDDNLQEFNTTDCKNVLFSANGRYCATIDSGKNMQVFALSSTAITPIYKRDDVKNIFIIICVGFSDLKASIFSKSGLPDIPNS